MRTGCPHHLRLLLDLLEPLPGTATMSELFSVTHGDLNRMNSWLFLAELHSFAFSDFLFPLSGCLSSVDTSVPQLKLWSLRLARFLLLHQWQLPDLCVWSSGWPMVGAWPRVVWKVSVKRGVVLFFWLWLHHKPVFLLLQRRWPGAPFMQTLTILSQRCSGTQCTLRSECWRGLILTSFWPLEDAGQLLILILIVYHSGTCWLMGKSTWWSDIRFENTWITLLWVSIFYLSFGITPKYTHKVESFRTSSSSSFWLKHKQFKSKE